MQSARETANEIKEFGSSVLRQVWPKDKLRQLRDAIASHVELRRQRLLSGAPTMPLEKMYVTHGIGTFSGVIGDGLARLSDLSELFCGSYFQGVCAEYFGSTEFYVSLNRIAFRAHEPKQSDRSFIPYHQDSYTQDPRVRSVLNCWIPLDPGAGQDAPGLEVVRNPCAPDFQRKNLGLKTENAAYDFITIEREKIVEVYGENFLAPAFEVGDGLAFSENVIHRTYVTPAMTKPRINLELRVFAPNSLVQGVAIADLGAAAIRLCS